MHPADQTVLLELITEAGAYLNSTRECLEDLTRDALVNPHPYTKHLEAVLTELTTSRDHLRTLYTQIKRTPTEHIPQQRRSF